MRLRARSILRAASCALCLSFPAVAAAAYEATGPASWYGDELRGRKTASGEPFDPDGLTAAHRTLPLSSYVEVTSLDTGKAILVRVNDRGPYHGNRLIDLSWGAARELGLVGHGSRMVRIRQVNPSEGEKLAHRRGLAVRAGAVVRGDELDRLRDKNDWSPPVSTRATIPPGRGPYFVRVGTFSSKGRAESMARRLGATLFESGGLYQVRLGPYADANKVNAALAPLAAKGYPDVRIVR
jgi:rare lipoprotein A